MKHKNLPKAVVSWSSGKDCAFALHQVQQQGLCEVTGLLTIINSENDRIPMHSVREELLRLQADALGLPVERVMLPAPYDDQVFRNAMGAALQTLKLGGVEQIVFGDLFLEDLRRYREEQMQGSGLVPVFPLWKRDSTQLARDMIEAGLKAVVTNVDLSILSEDFVGRRYDQSFLNDLPANVDPCGENGEFHSVIVDGPMFSRPIGVQPGDRVTRGGFAYMDVIPS